LHDKFAQQIRTTGLQGKHASGGEFSMKRWLMTMCFAALMVSGALAQQKKTVPPPPKPADPGPSLEVTMKFIQEKLDVGPVNFAAYVHDNAVGNDWTNQFKIEITNIAANAGTCRISYHLKNGINGAAGQDADFWFLLNTVPDVAVMPIEPALKEADTGGGHPTWNSRVEPPVFVLRVHRTDIKGNNDFYFFDEQMANRVAKALVHAVELCGGGGKTEPF
jgi:hypothetical protein